MPKSGGVADFNTFVKGIITEASPLTYPENASLDESNFELQRTGARFRRLGMDLEPLHVINTVQDLNVFEDEQAITSHLWEAAGNKGGNNFIMVQFGRIIQVFAQTGLAASGDEAPGFSIDLEQFSANSDYDPLLKYSPVSYSNIKGYLLITGEYINPVYCTYDPDSGTLSTNKITVEIRDFLGLEDGFPVDYRPATAEMNTRHQYNLKNQGWTDTNIAAFFTSQNVYPSNADVQHLGKNATDDFDAALLVKQFFGNTPAPRGSFKYDLFNKQYRDYEYDIVNAITNLTYDDANNVMTVQTSGTHGLAQGQDILMKGVKQTVTYTVTGPKILRTVVRDIPPELDIINNKNFDVATVIDSTRFTINVNIDLTSEFSFADNEGSSGARGYAASGGTVTSYTLGDVIEEFLEERRFEAIAGYASRAWYSGINGGEYSNYVLYSQILEKPEQIGKCYQDADPTSEHVSDLVDTDGGVIIIPEMNRCISLTPMGSDLFVFGNNGVWRISGIDGTFTATTYKVEKVSSVGVEGRFTIVPTESSIYYFAKGGIYRIMQNTVQGNYYAENISETSIQSLFNSIPNDAREHIKGNYDPASKVIEWMYMDDPAYLNTNKSKYCYNTFLRLDTVLEAFYKYNFVTGNNWLEQYGTPLISADLTPYISGSVVIPTVIPLEDVNLVTSLGDQVQADAEDVQITEAVNRTALTQTKYLVMVPWSLSISIPDSLIQFVEPGITFGQLYKDSFLDWEESPNTQGPYDYESYLITGANMYGSQSQKKQAHYVLFYFNRTEGPLVEDENQDVQTENPSSCLVRGQWEWANSPNSGRWTSEFQAYRIPRFWYAADGLDPYDYGQEMVISKSKLRGRGRALSLYIKSESGKDMQLNGWSTVMSASPKP